MGVGQGFIAGALVTFGLTYATAGMFRINAAKVHLESQAALGYWNNRNVPVPHVSNRIEYEYHDIIEGAKDLWNEQVSKGVGAVYNMRIGERTSAAIASIFN